jgi:ankyrin repeat protein
MDIAVLFGLEGCVERLAVAGADVDVVNKNGYTPITIASCLGHEGCVERLAAAGADVDVEDEDGYTPVYVASHNGHEGKFVTDLTLQD